MCMLCAAVCSLAMGDTQSAAKTTEIFHASLRDVETFHNDAATVNNKLDLPQWCGAASRLFASPAHFALRAPSLSLGGARALHMWRGSHWRLRVYLGLEGQTNPTWRGLVCTRDRVRE